MNANENTRPFLTAACAAGTIAGTLLLGSGVLLVGLAVVAGAGPLTLAIRRRARVRIAPRPPAGVELRPSGS